MRRSPCQIVAPLGAGGMGEVYRGLLERAVLTDWHDKLVETL